MQKDDTDESQELKRTIGPFQAVMYGIGLILGAGIYVLIGDAAGIAGNAMWLSFIVAAVIATFTGYSYAELSSRYPRSAAEYVYVKHAFKNEFLAFVSGYLVIFVAIVSAAAVAIGFAGYVTFFLPQIDSILVAILIVIVLSGVSFAGIRESAWMNTIFTLIEILGLGIIIAAGLFVFSPETTNFFEIPDSIQAEAPVIPGYIATIASAVGLIFFAYYGFENLANIAEETKNPRRTIPRALVISIAATTAIYILVAISSVSLVGWEELSSSDAAVATLGEKSFGRTGVILLSGIALFATSNTVLIMLVSGSRIIYGMSKYQSMPKMLSKVHGRTKTPWISIVVIMISTSGAILISGGNLVTVANASVFGIFIVYSLVNLSLIVIRYHEKQTVGQFRSPVSIGRFPVLAGLGLVTSILMLLQFDSLTVIAGILAIVSAVIVFVIIHLQRTQTKKVN